MLSFLFSRPIVFPTELLAPFDNTYIEQVPELTATDEDLQQIDILYEKAYAIAEAKAIAQAAKELEYSAGGGKNNQTGNNAASNG